jgi:hypothetical protein
MSLYELLTILGSIASIISLFALIRRANLQRKMASLVKRCR